MNAVRITEDILLKELFDIFPEAREILMDYGYRRFTELDVENVVIDKLTLRGFFRLMSVGEEEAGSLIREIQTLYNKKLEEI